MDARCKRRRGEAVESIRTQKKDWPCLFGAMSVEITKRYENKKPSCGGERCLLGNPFLFAFVPCASSLATAGPLEHAIDSQPQSVSVN